MGVNVVTITLEEADSHSGERKQAWCAELEAGAILYFPVSPVAVPENDIKFLRRQHQSSSSLHKNIAYKPELDKLSGVDAKGTDGEAVATLQRIMRDYSTSVTEFLTRFLAPYKANWRLDYASFRPYEEEARDLPLRHRNDLLHTDAFPTRPTHGARILRYFSNIHASRTRDWVVSDPFAVMVGQFVPQRIAPKVDGALMR
ncbi:MAG TPA: Kdo hydroxylase family protein, partial [Edaphobacter sp.]